MPLSNANPVFTGPSGVGPKSNQPALGTTAKLFKSLGAWTPARNSKSPARKSLYQGANQCQTTLLLEQRADVSPACNATPSQRELASNAEPLPQREEPSAVSTVERQLALIQNKADSVVQKLKPSMAMKDAKREPNVLKVCVGFVS